LRHNLGTRELTLTSFVEITPAHFTVFVPVEAEGAPGHLVGDVICGAMMVRFAESGERKYTTLATPRVHNWNVQIAGNGKSRMNG